jgi:hypothetical protein
VRLKDINLHPDTRILRQFGAACLLIVGGAGVWKLFTRGVSLEASVLAAVGIVVGLLGLAAPRLVRPIYAGAMILAFPIGWVVSHAFLAVLYYAVLTPIGMVFRFGKRDRLGLKRPDSETCWVPLQAEKTPESYFRQF